MCIELEAFANPVPFRFDEAAEAFNAGLLHQNLDASLVFVIAPPELVIDPKDCLKIGNQVLLFEEGSNDDA